MATEEAGTAKAPPLDRSGAFAAPEAPWDLADQAAAGSRRPRIGGTVLVLVQVYTGGGPSQELMYELCGGPPIAVPAEG